MLYELTQIFLIILINNQTMLTSTLAAGIVLDALALEAGDAKRRRLKATSTAHAGNSSVS